MTKPKLSIVMNIARASYSMRDDWAEIHLFDMLCDSLKAQQGEFPPFEVVIADTEYDTRPTWFEDNPQPFAVKHIPAESWWLDRGLCAISRCKNISVMHAEGEWIITVDDSTALPPQFLARACELFSQGLFPVAWYNVVQDPNYEDPRLTAIPVGEEMLVEDDPSGEVHGWGFVGFTAAAFYEVNGYEEWFDGGRGQEDIEFSLRLLRAGHRLAVHRDLWVGILPQGPTAVYNNPDIPEGVVHCTSGLAPVLYAEVREGTRTRANAEPYPDRIRNQMYPVCRWYCPDTRHDKRVLTCTCGADVEIFGEMLATIGDEMPCSDCDGTMTEDEERRVDLAGQCTLYRNPCPFTTPWEGDTPRAFPDQHAQHELFHKAFIESPEQWCRELLDEHEKSTAGPLPERGTFVGVDWRTR